MAAGPDEQEKSDENGRERIVQATPPDRGPGDSGSEAEIIAGEQALEERAQQLAENPPDSTDVEQRMPRDLRPRHFRDYVGQKEVVNSISIAVLAAGKRGDTLDHALFHGPPGLGKTTIAHIIARELDSTLVHTSGPALERPADVVGLLSNLKTGDVLFIDEIHRLSHAVEEYLYSAMEDFRVDFMTGSGAFAKSINLPLQPFTLIGSTTRAGMLSAEQGDLSRLPANAVLERDRIVGQEAARPLPAGTVIQSHQLRKPALVERRQAVTLVAGGEGFRISREGHALDDGALGGRVRVRLSNREVVTAQVTGPGRARVMF